MVNNPLYPGYIPRKKDEQPMNPMYPGYYTGTPISKRPNPNYLQPMEYNFDVFLSGVDEVANSVANAPLGPKWFVERVADDWKSQLTASVSPKSEIDVTELDDYATDDIAGATTTLSLDPKNWTGEKAKKQAVNTIKNWVKESTGLNISNITESDFSDIQNKAREELWLNAMGYGDASATPLQQKAARAISERTSVLFPDVAIKIKPLDISHVDTDGEKDIYRDTALAAAEFIKNQDNRKARDSKYTTFLSKSLKAMNLEIADKVANNPGNATLARYENAIELFNVKSETLKSVEELQLSIAKKTESLYKKGIGGRDSSVTATTVGDLLRNVTDTETALAAHIARANNLRARGVPGTQIDKYLDEITKYSDRITEIKTTLNDTVGRTLSPMEMRTLAKSLQGSTPNKNFSNRTTFQNNLAGNLRKDLERSIIGNGIYDIGGLLNDPGAASLGIRAQNLAPVIYRLNQDRIRNATKEVLDVFDSKGFTGLAENYVWKRIKNELPKRLEMISGGEIVGEALKRRNYFGLKVDEDFGIPTDPRKLARFEKMFGYKVNVELDPALVGIGVGRKNLLKLKSSDLGGSDADPLQILADTKGLKFLDFNHADPILARENRDLFSRLLNNDRSTDTLDLLSQKLFSGKTLSRLTAKERDDFDKFIIKIEKFSSWARIKTGGRITPLTYVAGSGPLTGADENNPVFLLFKSVLRKNNDLNDGYKMTDLKFIGALQKINNKMQDLQKRFQKTRLGKIIKKFSNWRDMLAEKIAALISKAIAKALGMIASLTGALAVIMPIITAILEKVIRKTIDRTVEGIKALMKLDFAKIDEMFQKDLKKLVSCCVVAFLPIGCFILIPVTILFSMILTTIPQIDGTRDEETGICRLNLSPLEEWEDDTLGSNDCNTCLIDKSYEIVSNLKRGYWGYYNDSRNLPEGYKTDPFTGKPIFNEGMFNALGFNTCEEDVRAQGDLFHLLFWCTWLTRMAYIKCGIIAPNDYDYLTAGAQTTMDQLKRASPESNWSFIPNGAGVLNSIKPGDVIFYGGVDDGDIASHVAIVWEVNIAGGYITTLESNAIARTITISVDANGKLGTGWGMNVLGFGAYRGDDRTCN